MENIVSQLSRYIIIILVTIYTLYSFTVFRNNNKVRQNRIYRNQRMLIFIIHAICYTLLYINTKSIKLLYLYGAQVLLFIFVFAIYRLAYRNLSRLILNNMSFMIMIGFVMLTRISYNLAIKQFTIIGVSLIICLIIPYLIEKMRWLNRLEWIYGFAGLAILLLVMFFGKTQYGATNWIFLFGVSVQPSEFVKIIFVFFIASLLAIHEDFIDLVKITVMAAAYVLTLVLEKDLGGALIFFVTYLVMLYIATSKALYLFAGLAGGSLAAAVAHKLFYHVQVRVMAWYNPWPYIDKEGYQITQSLFAIGTGGWFGLGLGKGMPGKVPVVESDFIISAISEELGVITAICIILICLSCFVMFVNIGMKLKNKFYKLVALGLSVMYIFQVFLTIGGAIKFIPSTGVTLPLISYGGSSAISTIIVFCIIQGLYVINQNEVEQNEKVKLKGTRKKQSFTGE